METPNVITDSKIQNEIEFYRGLIGSTITNTLIDDDDTSIKRCEKQNETGDNDYLTSSNISSSFTSNGVAVEASSKKNIDLLNGLYVSENTVQHLSHVFNIPENCLKTYCDQRSLKEENIESNVDVIKNIEKELSKHFETAMDICGDIESENETRINKDRKNIQEISNVIQSIWARCNDPDLQTQEKDITQYESDNNSCELFNLNDDYNNDGLCTTKPYDASMYSKSSSERSFSFRF